ncbi:hypothetical protein F511_13643 [Dorcoceras hygrometricum]|uniref:Uncharacterized protein n=1 Tax=Dorcoceras hygrometricum TaxID=472368 RepID=A0A2Z7B486_9LAMI|nr:hypothetical protein F511_13643 [Dorcoceras hygrometricum]
MWTGPVRDLGVDRAVYGFQLRQELDVCELVYVCIICLPWAGDDATSFGDISLDAGCWSSPS